MSSVMVDNLCPSASCTEADCLGAIHMADMSESSCSYHLSNAESHPTMGVDVTTDTTLRCDVVCTV